MYTGSVTTIIGPMFGGKSSRLLTELKRNLLAGRKVLLIKHPDDNRYGNEGMVITHDRVSHNAYVSKSPNYLYGCGMGVIQISKSYDVVCIDEGQFYHDIDTFCDELANYGVKVYCSALLADYNRKPFGRIPELMAISDDIIHVKAVDRKSGLDASFTKRLVDDNENSIIKIGGSETYDATDRFNYFNT